jgi:hypothetical protein
MAYVRSHARLTPGRSLMRMTSSDSDMHQSIVPQDFSTKRTSIAAGRPMQYMMSSDMQPISTSSTARVDDEIARLQLYLDVQADRLAILRSNYFTIAQQSGQNNSGYPDPTKPNFSTLKGISDRVRLTEQAIKDGMSKLRAKQVLLI